MKARPHLVLVVFQEHPDGLTAQPLSALYETKGPILFEGHHLYLGGYGPLTNVESITVQPKEDHC